MQRYLFLPLFLFSMALVSRAQLPRLASGRIERVEQFRSKQVPNRNVDVWLPEGYDSARRYPVLYMQDGQMLFDSSLTWNHLDWQADETLGRLIRDKKIKPCILVAIWNTGNGRHADYFPQKPFEMMSKADQDSFYHSRRINGASVYNQQRVRSDAYLRFLVNELKPYIDSHYATLRDKANTFIGGSSMGGLISLYAICEYPAVFGGAICMSTHWPGIFTLEGNPFPDVFLKYLKRNLPSPRDHRLYFDHGDKTLDAWYSPFQKQADALLRSRGYTAGKNWQTKVFPGEDHSETAWARRFDLPLKFLLGK